MNRKFLNSSNHGQEKLPVVFSNHFIKNESCHVFHTQIIKDYKRDRTNRRWGDRIPLNKGSCQVGTEVILIYGLS